MAIAQGAPMSTSVRVGTPAVRGFQATLVSEIKNEPDYVAALRALG